MSDSIKYSALNPGGIRKDIKRISMTPRPETLKGKTVYCIAQYMQIYMEEIAGKLKNKLPDTKIVFRKKPGWVLDSSADLMEELTENADALIYGITTGGGNDIFAVGWIAEAEKNGIPSVYLLGEALTEDIKASAEIRGMPDMRRVILPMADEKRVSEDISEKQYSEITSSIISALTRPLNEEERKTEDITAEKPERIAVTGSLSEVMDYFNSQRWTDGLPIIPPTEKEVKKFLDMTGHHPDVVITEAMAPEEYIVTVEKVAIVGVMAGCKPEYMPLLLAITETWGKGFFSNFALRSDSSMSWITLVNGPIRNELGMNYRSGAMNPGNHANSTIGRFVNLAIAALGGAWSGINDMSAQGNPSRYNLCIPENEEDNPWAPYHVSSGYKPDDSVVSMFYGGWSHTGFLGDLDFLTRSISTFTEPKNSLLLLAPGAAKFYAGKGMSKEDVEEYIAGGLLTQDQPPPSRWFTIPTAGDKNDDPAFDMSSSFFKVVVLGGETALPVAQVWQASPLFATSVDKWR